MDSSFEYLINSYLETKVGIATNFLSAELAQNLATNINNLHNQNKMRPAGTGSTGQVLHDKKNRGDAILWLDRAHNDKDENDFLDQIDRFVTYLNEQCYTGIKSYEFHYTFYEPGTFYKRHLDQFQNSNNRAFSMITYLNADWQKSDGGELSIYHSSGEQCIEPINRKTVFFKSNELEHEVLTTHKNRLSITGWLKT